MGSWAPAFAGVTPSEAGSRGAIYTFVLGQVRRPKTPKYKEGAAPSDCAP